MSEPADQIGEEPVPKEISRTRSESPAEAQQFTVRQSVSTADRAAQLDLRYRVLREPLGMSREQAIFARDDDPDTVHLLAVADDHGRVVSQRFDEIFADRSSSSDANLPVIGTATLITHGPNDVQLRGMASDPAWAGSGVGRAVLEAAHKLAGSRSLWCDARMSAHDFYARFGWVAEGEVFDIPHVGPHTVMRYRGSNP
jgi:GNAT superfamily N-acetyltransferase